MACLDPYDVLVVEMPQDLDLAQRPLRVRQVLKGLVDLLDGDLLARGIVESGAHHTIRAMPDGLDQRVARVDVEARATHHEGVHRALALHVRQVCVSGCVHTEAFTPLKTR